MRNYKGTFYRTDEVSKEPNQCPDWLDLFATNLFVEQTIKNTSINKTASSKTAVEVARERQTGPSVYEMMSAIVSNQKPKYSSVEEAVKDYQKQTGLDEYLKRSGESSLSAIASQIIAAGAHGSCAKCGCSHEECECDKNDVDDEEELEKDEEDEEDEDKEDEDEDKEDEDEDDAYAVDMTSEELEAIPGKKKLITKSDNLDDKPELLKNNPAIESFLRNIIDTNIGIQMPAILHSLIETFGRDGIDYTIFSDENLLHWINNQLINKGISSQDVPSHLGRGVGTHIDYSGDRDPNKDPFTLLVPDKGY